MPSAAKTASQWLASISPAQGLRAMSEELPNLSLLIKLLKMTTSSNDAEALLAVRKANEQLQKFGGDWERLLRSRVTIIGADPFSAIPEPPKPAPFRRPEPTTSYTNTWNQNPERPVPNPRPAASQTPPTNPAATNSRRANMYAGYCFCCGIPVPVNAGIIERISQKWETICSPCEQTKAPRPARRAKAKPTKNSVFDSLNLP